MARLAHKISLALLLALALAGPVMAEEDPLARAFRLQTDGELEARRDNWLMAEQYFLQALELDPRNETLIRLAARAAIELGSGSRAAEVLRTNVDVTPHAVYGLALIALDNREYAEAETWLTRYLTQDPKNARAVFMLGLAQFRQGRVTQAYQTVLDAAKLDPALREDSLVIAAEAKLREGNTDLPRKALKMAANGKNQRDLVRDRIRDFGELLDSMTQTDPRWWLHLYLDNYYNDNKLFATHDQLDAFSPAGGGTLENSGVLRGFEGHLRAAVATNILTAPVQLQFGYGLHQQIYGGVESDFQAANGSSLTLTAPYAAQHQFWLDTSYIYTGARITLLPGLELAGTMDLPSYQYLRTFQMQVAPRLTLMADDRRSLTFFTDLRFAPNYQASAESYNQYLLGVNTQYTWKSIWRYVRGGVRGGLRNANDDLQDLTVGAVRFDMRQPLGPAMFADLMGDVAMNMYSNQSRTDTVITGDASLGYSFRDRKFLVAAVYQATLVSSSESRFDRTQNVVGLRLGGALP